ncbi:MAG TPA: helix-turn-helix domain-containing protein [Pseudomonadota bacterium]|nr:helix-turn-helix domain-containing protein [Pseudomonadota bacterium]
MSQLLKPKEAAKALSVGVKRIYHWIKSGELVHYRFGERDFRIPVEAILQFKEQRLCESPLNPTENPAPSTTSQTYPRPMGQHGPSRWTQPTWRKLESAAPVSPSTLMEPLRPRPPRKKLPSSKP